MNDESVVVTLRLSKRDFAVDLDVPLNITANDLVIALNSAYDLGIDISDAKNCYLKAENPIALLRGNKPLAEYGLHNGTRITFDE